MKEEMEILDGYLEEERYPDGTIKSRKIKGKYASLKKTGVKKPGLVQVLFGNRKKLAADTAAYYKQQKDNKVSRKMSDKVFYGLPESEKRHAIEQERKLIEQEKKLIEQERRGALKLGVDK